MHKAHNLAAMLPKWHKKQAHTELKKI